MPATREILQGSLRRMFFGKSNYSYQFMNPELKDEITNDNVIQIVKNDVVQIHGMTHQIMGMNIRVNHFTRTL